MGPQQRVAYVNNLPLKRSTERGYCSEQEASRRIAPRIWALHHVERNLQPVVIYDGMLVCDWRIAGCLTIPLKVRSQAFWKQEFRETP